MMTTASWLQISSASRMLPKRETEWNVLSSWEGNELRADELGGRQPFSSEKPMETYCENDHATTGAVFE